jgi:RNA-directed DNA polymerase
MDSGIVPLSLEPFMRQPHSLQGVLSLFGQGEAESPGREPDAGIPREAGEGLTDRLMELVVDESNIRLAVQKVKSNRGAPGADGISVDDLEAHLSSVWPEVSLLVLEGRYRPSPVLRKVIPKAGGGERALGIPTVRDRVIQQALLQVLEPMLDPTFSPHSYGFRPGRSAHQAVLAARSYIEEGYDWVVDVDLEKFFDRVNHDVLMNRLARRIGDKRLLRLVRSFLNAGIMADGVKIRSEEGTPQGGPLSPLLANLLLDELDRELESRGLRFARYADDCNVYVRSERAGQRVMASMERFLEVRLRLRVNRAKSAVARPAERRFLGFRLSRAKHRVHILVHPGSLERFKSKVRELTSRSRGVSASQVVLELSQYLRGWGGYYGRILSSARTLEALDGWCRRRVRQFLWVQWKTRPNRFRQLVRGGVNPKKARSICLSRSKWYPSNSDPVKICLTNARLAKGGLFSLAEQYHRRTSV